MDENTSKNNILNKLKKQLIAEKSWSDEKRKKEWEEYINDPNSIVNKSKKSKKRVQLWNLK